MKPIIPAIVAFLYVSTIAQADWLPFPLHQYTYYTGTDEYYKSTFLHVVVVDSVSYTNGVTTYHYRHNLPFTGIEDCNTFPMVKGSEWDGLFQNSPEHYYDAITVRNDSVMLYTAAYNTSLLFKPWVNPGEQWVSSITFHARPFDKLRFTCTQAYVDTVFSIQDSIKIFILQALDSKENPVSSPINSGIYKLSKRFGLLQFIPLQKIVGSKNDPMMMRGFSNDSTSEGFLPLDFTDVIQLKPGDKLYWKKFKEEYYPRFVNVTFYWDSITQVIKTADTITIHYDRRDPVTGALTKGTYIYSRTEIQPLLSAPEDWIVKYGGYSSIQRLYIKESWYLAASEQLIQYGYYGHTIYQNPEKCIFGITTDTYQAYTFSTMTGQTEYLYHGLGGTYSTTLVGRIVGGQANGDTLLAINHPSGSPSFTVFPNPATDKLFIKGLMPGEENHAVLYNLNGEALLGKSWNGSSADLDLASLAAGFYLLEVTNFRGRSFTKVVISK